MVSQLTDFNRKKQLFVDSVGGTPTVDKATPIQVIGEVTPKEFDGFEDGDFTSNPSWNDRQFSNGQSGDGTLTVQSTTVKNGSNSLNISTDGSGDQGLNHDRGSSDTISDGDVYNAWVRQSNESNAGCYFGLLNEDSSNPVTKQDGIAAYMNEGNFKFQTYDSSGSIISDNTLTTHNSGEWYRYELTLMPSTSEANIVIYDESNSVVDKLTGVPTSGASNLRYIALHNNDTTATNCYFDDVSYSENDANQEYISDQDAGNGSIILDWDKITDEQDLALYDQNGSLLDYEIEDLDTTAETGVLWCYNSWVRDGTTQAQVAYGNNSDNTDNQNVTETWSNTGQNALQVYHFQNSSTIIDSVSNSDVETGSGNVSNRDASLGTDGAYSYDGTDDYSETNSFVPVDGSGNGTIIYYGNINTSNSSALTATNADFDTGDNAWALFVQNDNDLRISINQGLGGDGEPLDYEGVLNGTDTYHMINAISDDGSGGTDSNLWVNGTNEGTQNNSSKVMAGKNINDLQSHQISNELDDGAGRGNYSEVDVTEIRYYSDTKDDDWKQAEYDATPIGGQVFFSQQAAEDTVQITTDTAQTTSFSMTPQTSNEVNNRFDNAVTTSFVLTPQTSNEVNNAVDTAVTTSYVMSPQTSNDFENFTDTAVTTSYTMTPQTSTESQVNIDVAQTTSFAMTPETSTEVQTNLDVAQTTSFAMTPEESVETNNVTDTATTTTFVMSPQSSTEVVSFTDSAQTTTFSMTPKQSAEFGVEIDTAQTTFYSMTPGTSSELEIFVGQNTLLLDSFEKSIVLDQNVFKVGDTNDSYSATLKKDGVARNLQNANTVELFMRSRDGTNKVDAGSMSITNSDGGRVEYDWQSSDVDTAGVYRTEVKVTFNNGKEETYPSDDYQIIEIEGDLE